MEEEDKTHRTQLLKVGNEIVDVDIKMIPFIKWMNSLDGIMTLYCCQGWRDRSMSNHKPYVLFECDNSKTLLRLLEHTSKFSTCYVDEYQGKVRYTLRFFTIYYFNKCKKELKL